MSADTGSTTIGLPERTELRVVRALAAKELRDALRDRWLWLYGASFAVVATGITSIDRKSVV